MSEFLQYLAMKGRWQWVQEWRCNGPCSCCQGIGQVNLGAAFRRKTVRSLSP